MTGTAPEPTQCLFCATNDPDANHVLMQNATCYARYDNYPAAAGHVEIVPKRHVESFFDLHLDEVADAYSLLVRAKTHLGYESAADGYTIGVNEGRAAGRTIDHVHIHLIPRRFGDVPDPRGGIRAVVPGVSPDAWTQLPGAELEQIAAAPWPHRLARYGGYALHAAKALPSGAFETACGWLSGPGDNKHHNDQRPVTCRECKRRIGRERREEGR